MDETDVLLPWEQPGWPGLVSAWIEAQLAVRQWRVAAPLELLHQRAWSAFGRVMTDHGTVYFKAPAPAFRYEAALTQVLERLRPDCITPLLALDFEHGWILSADAGPTLRSAFPDAAGQIERWVKLLPFYAELQIEMVPYLPELLATGVPDRRLAALPGLYERLLEETDSLRVGLEPGLTAEEHRRLIELRPQVAAWCDELAGYGLPETLTHEEVHDANVLAAGERTLFTDWSDASVAHPFFTMLVTIRAAAYRLKLDEFGAEMLRLRDAYLEPWTRLAPRDALLAAFPLAYRLGMINRALSWQHGTGQLAFRHREPYLDSVPGWLQDFLHGDAFSLDHP